MLSIFTRNGIEIIDLQLVTRNIAVPMTKWK
jgi:hypothetical protein